MAAAKTKAETAISENAVMVFSKSYCPYCTASKRLLTELGAKYETMELDLVGEFILRFPILHFPFPGK
jgi:glutaredoxin 3